MINKKMQKLGSERSVIRDIFEYGLKRKREIGEENVFDFSLGNPSLSAPLVLDKEIVRLASNDSTVAVHGYTSAAGDPEVRRRIAEYIKDTHGFPISEGNIYMTAGAAAALTSTLGAIVNPGEEVIVLAPYFPEYKVFIENSGGKVVEVACDKDFAPDTEAIREAINESTAAIIINSPNNPSGAVFSEEKIKELAAVLYECEERYEKPIYLISDEPYRELVYGEATVPYVPKYYKNTIVCYSFSKSMSIPGERIGYVAVSPEADGSEDVYAAVCGAGRALGYVCAPSLMQRAVAEALGELSDIAVYDRNRLLLYQGLTEMGYEAVKPDGAFYLFLKSPIPDAKKFAERARAYELLVVPSDSFGITGYVRISYCVNTERIIKAMPAFRALAEEYGIAR